MLTKRKREYLSHDISPSLLSDELKLLTPFLLIILRTETTRISKKSLDYLLLGNYNQFLDLFHPNLFTNEIQRLHLYF